MNLFVLEIHNLAIDNEGAIPIVVNRRRSVKFKALGRFFISIHQRLVKSEVDFQEMEVFKVLGDAVYLEDLFNKGMFPFPGLPLPGGASLELPRLDNLEWGF